MTIGCIHGRFQPFHNGHFEYLKAAYERSERLIVGITQYDQAVYDQGSPAHRLNVADNPFTYWDRAEFIRAAINYEGIPEARITIVPFPIHAPDTIKNFVDPESVMFTTIYEKWNIEKIRRLRAQGFPVRVLWRRNYKQYEGKEVRLAMREDLELFQTLVPQGVYDKLRDLGRLTANRLIPDRRQIDDLGQRIR